MSRFYMTADNSRGNRVSAAGRSNGQTCHIRGWNLGVQVDAAPKDAKNDEFSVKITGGSHDPWGDMLLRVFESEDGVCIDIGGEVLPLTQYMRNGA